MRRASGTTATVIGGLSLLVLIVFAQTTGFQFVNYDDGSYVYQNSHVTSGLSWRNVGWAFTHVHSANWHPLTTLSHMADCHFFGLRGGPPHAVNVLLHLATTILLFQFLRSTTGQLWRAALVAALFAVHPLRAESVAWVSERKDVLSGLFFILTLLAYERYVKRPTFSRYLLVILALAGGLMSKPMLVTTPLILLLLDYWPLLRPEKLRRLILEKLPLVGLVLLSTLATLWAQRLALGTPDKLPLSWRASNALVSYVNYLRQMFWPADLVPFYLHPEGTLSSAALLSSVFILVSVTAAAVYWRHRFPWLVVGWSWYLIMLIPVIGLVQVGLQARADRYTYLPQIGVLAAVVWLAHYLIKLRSLRIALTALVLGLSTLLAFRQTEHWRDTETLWTYTLTKAPRNDIALTGLAGIQLVRGDTETAAANYQRAIDLRPGNSAAQHGLALALWRQHKVDAAISHWQQSLADQPDNNEARNYLGTALVSVGREEEAAEQWRAALRYDPDDGNAANNLAWLLATTRHVNLRNAGEAVTLAERATKLPGGDQPIVYRTLAAANAANGNFPAAIGSIDHGMELARAAGNEAEVKELSRLRTLFQSGSPVR